MSSADHKPIAVIPSDDPVQLSDSFQLERIADLVNLRVHRDTPADLTEQLARVSEAEIIINSRGHLHWRESSLQQLPRLKFITTCSIGVDAIDVQAARELGIIVSNIPGRTAQVVAEHAVALLLGVARQLAEATIHLKQGGWSMRHNTLLRGKTLGVIGTGAIGREVINLARAIGMEVQAWTFHPTDERAAELGIRFVELDQLLETSDAVSLHVKLTEQSRHLLDRKRLRRMKPGSLLINTARGPVVETESLVEMLQSGHLAGAGIDVFDAEPPPADNPLLTCSNVVLTPHSADQNPEGRELLNTGAVDNVLAYLRGAPQNVVE